MHLKGLYSLYEFETIMCSVLFIYFLISYWQKLRGEETCQSMLNRILKELSVRTANSSSVD